MYELRIQIAKFIFRQYLLSANSPNSMLTKIFPLCRIYTSWCMLSSVHKKVATKDCMRAVLWVIKILLIRKQSELVRACHL